MTGRGHSVIGSELTGRVALVTDAGAGIGAVVAIAIAEAGANLAICDRHLERLADTSRAIESIGRWCHAELVDLSDDDAVASWVTGAIAALGPVEIVVGSSSVIRHVAPVMSTGGSIVTVSPDAAPPAGLPTPFTQASVDRRLRTTCVAPDADAATLVTWLATDADGVSTP